MKVEEVQWGLRGYLQTVDLRKRVLRAPLGIEWTEEERAGSRRSGTLPFGMAMHW